MQTKEKTTNETFFEINIDMSFIAKIDMTEFNKQSIQVDKVVDERTKFVNSQVKTEKIKEIIKKAQADIEALGYECLRVNSAVQPPNPIRDIRKTIEGMLSGFPTPKL